MEHIGRTKRLKRIFSHESGKIVIVPLDDSLLAGATNGLENLSLKVEKLIESKPNAVIGFQGLFKNFSRLIGDTPSILNITASTTTSMHTRKVLVGSVELALMLGVEAVAVHVNISSKYENEMLKLFGDISMECHRVGMPLMGIMYPRNENVNGSDNNFSDLKRTDIEKYTKLVSHAGRVGVELGADFIKTQYTGNSETFKHVIEACNPIPVVVAGGIPVGMLEMLKTAEGAIKAGGAGISFGRNIFSRENPAPFIKAVKKVVYENFTAEQANDLVNNSETLNQ